MTTIFSTAGTGSRLWYASRTAVAGGNGTEAYPFQTFQAALNACAPGDGVVLLPGTYPENIVWPATDNIVVFSWGAIVTAAVGDTLSWIPIAGQAFDRMTILGVLTLRNTGAGRCLVLDGDATAVLGVAQFLKVGAIFDRLLLDKTGAGDAAFLRSTTSVEVNQGIGFQIPGPGPTILGWSGNTTLRNVGYVGFRNCVLGVGGGGGASLDYSYTSAVGVVPLGGRQGVFLVGTSCTGTVKLGKTPIFVIDPSSAIFDAITDTGLTTTVGPNHAPVIGLLGTIGAPGVLTPVTLSLPALVATGIPLVDFGRGTFYGPISVASFALGIARNVVQGRQARLLNPAAGAVLCGADTDLDIREASFTQASLAVAGNGAIDRDRHRIPAKAIVAAGTVVAVAPPFPVGAVFDVATEAAVATVMPGITVKTPAAFTASGVTLTVNFDLVRA